MVTRTSPTPSAETAPAEPRQGLSYRPNVDVRDRGTEVVFVADMPGAKADSIEVTVDDGVLTLHASVPPRELPGRAVRQEYGIGDYRRQFRLGEGFDASRIEAAYAQGVLTVHVPRLAAVLPRRVEVRAG